MVTVALALAMLAALVFWNHAFAKLRDLRRFALAVGTWRVVPVRQVWIVALMLPLYEVALATAMGLGVVVELAWGTSTIVRVAAFVAIATSSILMGGQTYLLMMHRQATCGCAGKDERVGWRSICRASLAGLACVPAVAVPN